MPLRTPLPIVHCSAGIGRTGCMLAIMNGVRQMRRAQRSSQRRSSSHHRHSRHRQPLVDVLAIVCNLRLQRGGMVQNSEQYELVHRALCAHERRERTERRRRRRPSPPPSDSDDDDDDSEEVDSEEGDSEDSDSIIIDRSRVGVEIIDVNPTVDALSAVEEHDADARE